MKKSNYYKAVEEIKFAIVKSQYEALKGVNEKQLMLYYAIGKYISFNSRNGFWGQGAINFISCQLQKELPGLRGFSERNIKNMRIFYEEWSLLDYSEYKKDNNIEVFGKLEKVPNVIWQSRLPNFDHLNVKTFLSISFTHHICIINSTNDINERIHYINLVSRQHISVRTLKHLFETDDYHHQGRIINNFETTITDSKTAFKAINTFKDEYLLNLVNVEELNIRDVEDIDERVIENGIVHNIKNFILTFGNGFAFIRNQYHLEAFGVDQYIDLLFFNRDLNCLVAVELKTGEFKPSYLGQLSSYISVLDEFERKEHENPSIGIILCRDMERSFVDFIIKDYSKPMGVSTYKTSKEMSKKIIDALPDIEDLKRIIEVEK